MKQPPNLTVLVQGYLAHKKPPPPQDPTVALCLETYGDPRGVGVSDERGTPVPECAAGCWVSVGTAAEPKGRTFNDFKDFYMKAKSRMWP